MAYIKGISRYQCAVLPASIEDYVSADNLVRLIDAFVDRLDLEKLGFKRAVPAATGAPGYDPKDLLKFYIYAYINKVRSSRKMAKEAMRNIELMWLLKCLMPDFRTIADFRKNNAKALKEVFREFNRICASIDLFGNDCVSIDGSKFKADNSKDKNFTQAKLDDRIKRIENHIDEYLQLLNDSDSQESSERVLSAEEIREKIDDLDKRMDDYQGYLKEMEDTQASQKSLTDPEAKLMKFKNGFEVGYNIQTAIDDKNQLISGFLLTDSCTDHGLLKATAEEVLDTFGLAGIDVIADKGYQSPQDMVACLENGIVPNVHPSVVGGSFLLNTEYQPCEITEEEKASVDPDDIKKCLRAGVVPDCYSEAITDIKPAEISVAADDDLVPVADATEASAEELIRRAKEGYFVRDPKHNRVFCPQGETLRLKSTKKDGCQRFYNKLACKGCKNKCTQAKHKEIDFPMLVNEKSANATKEKKVRRPKKKIAVIQFKFTPDAKKLKQRMSLSEHPFGSVKRWDDASYFLLRGKEKTSAEIALSFLAYNIKRAINLVGVEKLIDAIMKASDSSIFCFSLLKTHIYKQIAQIVNSIWIKQYLLAV